MNCRFTVTDRPHQHRCSRCGLVVSSPHAPERIVAHCVAAEEGAEAPSLPRRAWKLAQALAAFLADGLRTVDQTQYAQRLRICDACPERQGDTCGRCGCRLSLKARGKAFVCPLNKWPAIH